MRFLADENFPRSALEALRKVGWDVFSVAESCPGISDDEVVSLCADQGRVLPRSTRISESSFSGVAFRRPAASFCSVAPPSRPLTPRRLRWR